MGRVLRRVALDFDHPLKVTWPGFVQPDDMELPKCEACGGRGKSPYARMLEDAWYGTGDDPLLRERMTRAREIAEGRLADDGTHSWSAADPEIQALAIRNLGRDPVYYGIGSNAALREARRLAKLFWRAWCHNLDQQDVLALVADERLLEFTHEFVPDRGWVARNPIVIPTARQVNVWSLQGFGHDSINAEICISARCARSGEPAVCQACDGHGNIGTDEAREAIENWSGTPPPEGEGWQMWEDTSEGSPISPVFATPEALADFLGKYKSEDGSYDDWLKMILGPGWAMSMVGIHYADGSRLTLTGVEAAARMSDGRI